jgi:hypothetical protein
VRDVLKARRKATEGRDRRETAGLPDATADARPERAEKTPGAPPLPAARPPPPAVAAAATMSEPELRELYDAYVAAKRSCNEDVSRLSYEALARTVNKQTPEIAARFQAKRVEFKVLVRDGKAVLTAVPRV